MKKEDKFVYILSFILSLSMLFLLEACPFRLLANDIKVVEREEVEIELLLSDAAELFEEEGGSEAAEDSDSALDEEIAQENDTIEAEASEEVEPEPDRETETQSEEVEELVEEPEEIEEEPIEEIEEIEEEKELVEEIEEEPEEIEVVEEAEVEVEEEVKASEEEQVPEWVLSQDEVEEEPEESDNDSFDIDSYLTELRNNNDKDNDESEVVEEIVNRESEEIESSQLEEDQLESGSSEAADNAEAEVYDLRENDHSGIDRPSIRNYRAPEYPAQMRRRNIEGRVILSLKIDQDGKTSEFEIHDSSGYEAFDQAALSAVKDWEFSAARLDDKFVSVKITLPIRFELN